MKTIVLSLTSLLFIATVSIAVNSDRDPITENKPQVGVNVGDQAPDLQYNDPNGNLIKLSDYRGKVVLVDFWASWCRPCRAENPNVVSAYKKYKNAKFKSAKGFEIIGVSLDKAKDGWVKAIKDDNLTWPQMSDLGGWTSKPALNYKVHSIPASFLLDENGIIIAKNLRGANLDATVKKLTVQ